MADEKLERIRKSFDEYKKPSQANATLYSEKYVEDVGHLLSLLIGRGGRAEPKQPARRPSKGDVPLKK